MDRGSFLKKTCAIASGLMVGGWKTVHAYQQSTAITVLHTNDTLGHVKPLDKSASPYEGMGGMSRRASLLHKFREAPARPIILDAGNVTGSTIYTDVHGSSLLYKMMSRMRYDAATLGKRDLMQGLQPLIKALRSADFPIVASNYEISSSTLSPFIKRYLVLKRNNKRVGVFGLGFDGFNEQTNEVTELIEYRDPKLLSEAMVRKLRVQEECDLIICLSRLGFDSEDSQRFSDVQMARQVAGIDMIIGGPSHLFMKKGKEIVGPAGTPTVISQAGYGGAMLGRTTFTMRESIVQHQKSSNQLLT